MSKAKLVTRSETTSSVTDDNLGKAAALTHAEMDSNLINLRDASWGLADDSSTVLSVTNDKTITIAGGTGISTALSGDTLTITGPDLSSYITNSPITVVGDDSTGTVFNTGETVKIAGGTGITTAVSGDTVTITASGGGGGTITALNNQAENRITTIGATTTELDGEANLTFDGSTLTLTGSAALDGVTITDNTISTNASNADLEISANGTGRVMISANDSRGDNNILITTDRPKNVMIYEDANAVFGQYNYSNYIKGYYKIDSGETNSTSSSDRYRNVLETELDLNGKSSTSTSSFLSRGPMGSNSLVRVRNTGGADVTLGNVNGGQNGLTVYANTTNSITVTEAAGHSSFVEGITGSGLTADFTEAHGYYSLGLQQGGFGTTTATTFTHFHAVPSVGTVTNEYAFYAEDAGMNNLIGGVTLQNGGISTDGITINDNNITTSRSNDNLYISAAGTGVIALGEDFDAISTSSRYHYGVTTAFTGTLSGSQQLYPNSTGAYGTLTGDLTSGGRFRTEKRQRLDLAGYDITGSSSEYLSNGLTGFTVNPFMENNSATASTATELTGYSTQATVQANAGDLSLTNMVANAAVNYIYAQTGKTGAVTNAYGYISWGVKDDGGAGTKSLTNLYHYAVKANGNPITPSGSEYGFYVDDTTMANYIGGVTLQNGTISTDGISIVDNEITTTRSNDNLNLSANGTGRLVLSANGSRYEGADSDNPRNIGHHEDTAATFGTYSTANLLKGVWKIDSGQSNSTSSSDRWRNTFTVDLDLNGKSSTSTSSALTRGPQNLQRVYVRNSGGADVTLGNVNGGQNFIQFFLQNTNDMTVTEAAGHSTSIESSVFAGRTLTLPNSYGYHSSGLLSPGGGGTLSATNFTHFYAQKNTASATNEYGFYAEDGMLSRFGAVILGNLGSDPSTVADSAHIYAKDVSSSSEVFVRDEAGNVTQISPHNSAGEWQYYSVNERTGKVVRVNMERMIRKLEELTGETFIENQ